MKASELIKILEKNPEFEIIIVFDLADFGLYSESISTDTKSETIIFDI